MGAPGRPEHLPAEVASVSPLSIGNMRPIRLRPRPELGLLVRMLSYHLREVEHLAEMIAAVAPDESDSKRLAADLLTVLADL